MGAGYKVKWLIEIVRHVADTSQGVANSATFTAFTSFLANFEECFQFFWGQKTKIEYIFITF